MDTVRARNAYSRDVMMMASCAPFGRCKILCADSHESGILVRSASP